MWKPDYSATPGGGGQIGKSTATGATSISDAKFYVMNSYYEVFKCLYNGENPSNTTGQNATEEPSTTYLRPAFRIKVLKIDRAPGSLGPSRQTR